LSKKIITGLLRQDLGYEGLIITDDMEMGAISNHQSFRQAGAAAILAGADIVLVCHEYKHAEEAYMGIYEAVKSGEISEERLASSVKRIVKAKLMHGLHPQGSKKERI
jgi:beta-N-acetylhexosaminidase